SGILRHARGHHRQGGRRDRRCAARGCEAAMSDDRLAVTARDEHAIRAERNYVSTAEIRGPAEHDAVDESVLVEVESHDAGAVLNGAVEMDTDAEDLASLGHGQPVRGSEVGIRDER